MTSSTTHGHDGHRPGLMPRDEYGRDLTPRHRVPDGRDVPVYFAIAAWVPDRRTRFRRRFVMVLVGAAAVIAVTAAVLVIDGDARGAGRDATVAPAPTTGSSAGTPALLPRSAGTPRTELPPPTAAPPTPTAEQMTPPPVVSPRWPRHEAPTQRTPPPPPVGSPPSMSFAPKPVTPPPTATPGRNGHHGFF